MAARYLVKDIKFPEEHVPVPESVQISRDHYSEIAEKKKQQLASDDKARKLRDVQLRQRSLKYHSNVALKKRTLCSLERKAKLNDGFYRHDEAKVVFAVRIRGIRRLAPTPKKTLQLLRLRQLNTGVFVRMNKATQQMLRIVEPYITYGTLTEGRIRKLIYKRGHVKIGRLGSYNRRRIVDNDIISTKLGKYGIHGMEDVINELATCGPHFKEVNSYLWPFKLTPPLGGMVSKRRGFADFKGGNWGDRGEFMSQLVERMI